VRGAGGRNGRKPGGGLEWLPHGMGLPRATIVAPRGYPTPTATRACFTFPSALFSTFRAVKIGTCRPGRAPLAEGGGGLSVLGPAQGVADRTLTSVAPITVLRQVGQHGSNRIPFPSDGVSAIDTSTARDQHQPQVLRLRSAELRGWDVCFDREGQRSGGAFFLGMNCVASVAEDRA